MLNNKKQLITIIIATVLVIAIGFGAAWAIKSMTKQSANTQNQTQTPKDAADSLTMDAVRLLNSNPVKARADLEQALQNYKDLGDQNGVVNVQSQIYLLDHPVTKK